MSTRTLKSFAAVVVLGPPLLGVAVAVCCPPPLRLSSAVAFAPPAALSRPVLDDDALVVVVRRVVSDETLSDPLVERPDVRVPNERGWKVIDAIWSDTGLTPTEAIARDERVFRLCGQVQERRSRPGARAAILSAYHISG